MKKVSSILIAFFLVLVFPAMVFASKNGLVIYSFQVSGESAYDEFVSIKNESQVSIDLTNYSISRKTKSGTSWNTLIKFSAVTIGPGQQLVISHEKYSGIHDFIYTTISYSLTSDNSVAIVAPDKSVTDLVGYGESSTFEGTPLPNPIAKQIFTRINDTDNNSTDFTSASNTISIDQNADKLVISELLPSPSEGEEWFELFNQASQKVSLNGLKICDAIGSVHCYFFGNTDTINPFEYKTYSQSETKITMNNTGDWLELRDASDNLLADSGGNYGNADAGFSLSLFGSEFLWTKTATKGAQNIYTDTVEKEEAITVAPKSTTKKVKVTSTKNTQTSLQAMAEQEVLGASTAQAASPGTKSDNASKGNESNNEVLAYTLFALAISIFLGYNLWERREYVKKYYYKIIRRDR